MSSSESVGVSQFVPYIDSAKKVRNNDLTMGKEVPRDAKALRIAGDVDVIFLISNSVNKSFCSLAPRGCCCLGQEAMFSTKASAK